MKRKNYGMKLICSNKSNKRFQSFIQQSELLIPFRRYFLLKILRYREDIGNRDAILTIYQHLYRKKSALKTLLLLN